MSANAMATAIGGTTDDVACHAAVCVSTGSGGCQAMFDSSRSCQFATQADAMAAAGVNSAAALVCYRPECVQIAQSTFGSCTMVFDPAATCSLAAGAEPAQCMMAACVDTVGCAEVVDPSTVGQPCALNLVQLYGADNAVCYTSVCDATLGCVAQPTPGESCELDLVAIYGEADAPCYDTVCTDSGCEAVFDETNFCSQASGGVPDGGDAQCYAAACDPVAQACVLAGTPDAPCNDADVCTTEENLINNVTGSRADRCVASPLDNSTLVCRGADDPCAIEQREELEQRVLACLEENPNKDRDWCEKKERPKTRGNDDCTAVCQADAAGRFCVDPCVFAKSSAQSDVVGIAVGTSLGGAALLLLAVIFCLAYIKWGHQRLMKFLNLHDTQVNVMQDNPLHQGLDACGDNAVYDGAA